MNLKRFTGRNTKEAMTKVREAFGDDAVVVSTRPHPKGVEVVAMAPDTVASLERYDTHNSALDSSDRATPVGRNGSRPPVRTGLIIEAADDSGYHADLDPVLEVRPAPMQRPTTHTLHGELHSPAHAHPPSQGQVQVQEDVEKLAMSTLSFQDYVRERMLKRRKAALKQEEQAQREIVPPVPATASALEKRLSERAHPAAATEPRGAPAIPSGELDLPPRVAHARPPAPQPHSSQHQPQHPQHQPSYSQQARHPQVPQLPQLHDDDDDFGMPTDPPPANLREPRRPHSQRTAEAHVPHAAQPSAQPSGASREDHNAMMQELRTMKTLIEDRFGALAFMEKLQRSPGHARLTQRLLDQGFSPALIRKLTDAMGADITDEIAWAAQALERNLLTDEAESLIEDVGGVYALIGSTGVGKTTTTAKMAAAFAAKHGANHLGLITLDAYRVAAHEQLRAYGRILGVPVHTAHDRAALEDLLDLLSSKKMVLIDTAGLAQRDVRAKELLDMLGHPSIRKLVVVNAASQGETIDDVLLAYRASAAHGVVLSKVDEAVKLGPALDAMIRHRLKVRGIANGQRVPEDWHHLSANALVHRALRSASPSRAFRMDASEMNLVFSTPPAESQAAAAASAKQRVF